MKRSFSTLLILFVALVLSGCSISTSVNKPAPTPTPTPVKEQEYVPTPTPDPIKRITLSSVGDIMVHDNSLSSVKTEDGYDFDEPFKEIMPIIQAADFAIGNLETTLSGKDKKFTGYPEFNSPDSLLDTLKKTGFDLLVTTNNHCLDRGTYGLLRTLDQLDDRGFLHTGTYRTKEDSEKILTFDVNGIKFAIVAYTYGTNGHKIEKSYMVNMLKLNKMLEDIEKAKSLNPDLIIAYLHMGDELVRQPNKEQKDMADKLIKAGVDIILGDHPHVVQPMEYRTVVDENGQEREGFVIYSLGNFISGRQDYYREYGVILNMEIEKDTRTNQTTIAKVDPIPTWVQFYRKDGRDTYRVMPISAAIEKYESNQDEYITQKEYENLKDKLPKLLDHIISGPKK